MDNAIVKVFIGTDIEANYIAALLMDEDIKCIVRNAFQASVTAGWADGSPMQSTEIFVYEEDAEKAQSIVDKYLEEE